MSDYALYLRILRTGGGIRPICPGDGGIDEYDSIMIDIRGRRILIVEDEYFVADDLATDLRKLGAEIVGPVGNVAEALALIRANPDLDGAVLDINLHGQMSYPVAALLVQAGTPFLFATGYDGWTVDDAYRGIVRHEKPVRPGDVVTALFGQPNTRNDTTPS